MNIVPEITNTTLTNPSFIFANPNNSWWDILVTSMGGIITALVAHYLQVKLHEKDRNNEIKLREKERKLDNKSNIEDKRLNKYLEHRNTLVQIEHELIPMMVNLDRNGKSIQSAINDTNENNVQVILRFYELELSTGLSLKLLDIDLINAYSELYILLKTINSDVDYLKSMITEIVNDSKSRHYNEGLISMYVIFLKHLKGKMERIDQKSIRMLAIAQLYLEDSVNKTAREKYVLSGIFPKNLIKESQISRKISKITDQVEVGTPGQEKPEQFIVFSLNLRRQ